ASLRIRTGWTEAVRTAGGDRGCRGAADHGRAVGVRAAAAAPASAAPSAAAPAGAVLRHDSQREWRQARGARAAPDRDTNVRPAAGPGRGAAFEPTGGGREPRPGRLVDDGITQARVARIPIVRPWLEAVPGPGVHRR